MKFALFLPALALAQDNSIFGLGGALSAALGLGGAPAPSPGGYKDHDKDHDKDGKDHDGCNDFKSCKTLSDFAKGDKAECLKYFKSKRCSFIGRFGVFKISTQVYQ